METTGQLPDLPEGREIRSALSLELSLSPSEDANDLAAALSNEENETEPSMEAACELVQVLLDQVAWNDAPPTNEELSVKKSSVKTSKSPRNCSRQCHVQPLSPTTASQPSVPSAASDPSDIWQTHYNLRCTPSERKMGHVALATLCARTLETVLLRLSVVHSTNTATPFVAYPSYVGS